MRSYQTYSQFAARRLCSLVLANFDIDTRFTRLGTKEKNVRNTDHRSQTQLVDAKKIRRVIDVVTTP